MKICTKCHSRKSLINFFKNRSTKDGLNHWCKKCATRCVAQWRKTNLKKSGQYSITYYARHKSEIHKRRHLWRQTHKAETKKFNAAYQQKHKIKCREYTRRWKARNPGLSAFLDCFAKKERALRIPAWTNLKAIKQFYRDCPSGMVVDHIIPLRGKIVSGFHVLSNLQYLTPKQNNKKNNHWPLVR